MRGRCGGRRAGAGLLSLALLWSGAGAAAGPETAGQGPAGNPPAGGAWPQDFTAAEEQPASRAVETTQPAAALMVEELRARLAEAETAADLSAEVREEVLAAYRQALEQAGLAAGRAAKVAEYERGRQEAPQVLEAVRSRLAELAAQAAPQAAEVPAGAALEELAQELTQAEAELRARQEALSQVEAEARVRAERLAALPGLLADAKARLARLAEEPVVEGPVPQVAEAQRALRAARREALEQEVRAYEEEQRTYEARRELLAARRELARLEAAQAQARATAWREAVSARRQAEADRQKREAEAELERAPQPIRELAEENKRLADERAALVERIAAREESARLVAERSAVLGEMLARLGKYADQPGMGEVMGPLLREARERLRALPPYERELAELKQDLARVQLRAAELEDPQVSVVDVELAVAATLRKLPGAESPATRARLEPRVRALLQARRETLARLQDDYELYRADLAELIVAEAGLLEQIRSLREFIDQRVLWVRSTGPLWAMRVPREPAAPVERGIALAGALGRDVVEQPGVYALAALAFLGLLAVRGRLAAALAGTGERVARPASDRLALTPVALGWSAVLALPWPLLLGFLAWRVRIAGEVLDAAVYEEGWTLGAGLGAAAWFLLTIGLVRELCRRGGVAELHFRWNPAALRLVRRNLAWFAGLGAPLALLIVAAERHADVAWRDSVGRIAFIVGMAGLTVVAWRLLHPGRGMFAQWLRRAPGGWVSRLRHAWYAAAVGVPALLGLASAAGYHYTALQLTARLVRSAWLVVLVAMLHGLLKRAVLLGQRRIALAEARRRREALAEAKAAGPEGGEAPPPVEEPRLDLVSIGEQARQLLRTVAGLAVVLVLWLIWADMLPALSFMDHVRLWTYEVAGGADGGGPEVRAITLTHAALALLIGVATIVLARNIPGLMEITVLQRLALDAGGRFAATALARYAIVVVGVVGAFNAIGIGWSKVQWLVAAITVGLGFGLQEIFANFVSGLVLLFERPIRIGDTVTVGQISGTVSRIRIRATTITDWDRKELVIPNKEFITGQVVNWTLSDTVLRLVVPVGIAYGSDTDRAEAVLLEAARAEPLVLGEPPPRVYFLGFGDSALSFELRVYIARIEHLLPARHQLHKAIDRAFREAGIEIAFPQRDVHVRSIHAALPLAEPRPAAESAPRTGAARRE